ncbi:MAG: cytochrome b/b6 domain-containing protein [bacterium]
MERVENNGALVGDDEVFIRYPLAYRVQHFLLILTLTVLLATGLPLLFPDSRLFQALFIVPDLFVLRGQIHRVAAMALVALSAAHVLYLALSAGARGDLKEMIPAAGDARTAFASLRFSLGLTRERPRVGRFSPMQKLHYWVLCAGVLFMIPTGFALWSPDRTMTQLPKWVMDLAVTFHGYEALLVFLILMVWHIYTVHLTPESFPMSGVWLTGRITAGKMKKLYPGEYEKIVRRRAAEKDDDRVAGG